jgi:hypothetical protein
MKANVLSEFVESLNGGASMKGAFIRRDDCRAGSGTILVDHYPRRFPEMVTTMP